MRMEWENVLQEVLNEEVEQYSLMDAKVLRNSIEKSLDETIKEKANKKNASRFLTIKKAVIGFSILVFVLSFFTYPKSGDALIFTTRIKNFIIQAISKTQDSISFTPPDLPPIHEERTIDPDNIVVIDGPSQSEFTEVNLEDLLNRFPYTLYYPDETIDTVLHKTMYSKFMSDKWSIIFDFSNSKQSFSLIQETIDTHEAYGSILDKDDTEVYFINNNGIEYLIKAGRYNVLNIQWFQYRRRFRIIGNISVEQAIKVAESIKGLKE